MDKDNERTEMRENETQQINCPIRLFGTDGIRGEANIYPITAEMVLQLAIASAQYFMGPHNQKIGDHRFTVVIGKDTRLSGYMIESALLSGFVSMGADVFLLGPIPTPAVSQLTRSLRAHLGVMISASHNPAQDNGIKFFSSNGVKITSSDEKKIEDIVSALQKDRFSIRLKNAFDMGKAKRLDDASGRYIEFVKSTFPKRLRLDGLKIVVDCAHGAAYKVAPRVLWELGAHVIAIGTNPDGLNINKCVGALNPKSLQCHVLEHDAHIGIALDGDADRLLLVDEKGQIIDGDQILALIATLWYQDGRITGNGIVATHESNLGLEYYLKSLGLDLFRSDVGDRHVVSLMHEKNCNIGGEKSGHIILSDFVTTGDGLISALQILSLLVQKNMKAHQMSKTFKPIPQIFDVIKFSSHIKKQEILNDLEIQEKINDINLSGEVHFLVRFSGTEPLIRLTIQGVNEKIISDHLLSVKNLLQKKIDLLSVA
jgi:phosphoglucosamine mutase